MKCSNAQLLAMLQEVVHRQEELERRLIDVCEALRLVMVETLGQEAGQAVGEVKQRKQNASLKSRVSRKAEVSKAEVSKKNTEREEQKITLHTDSKKKKISKNNTTCPQKKQQRTRNSFLGNATLLDLLG